MDSQEQQASQAQQGQGGPDADQHRAANTAFATPASGLSAAQVAERIARGQVNADADVKTKSVAQIVRDNICTLFNLVNIIIAAAIFWTGEYRNLLFMGVILCNIGIGIFQEVRSKMTIDRLSVITSTKAHVIRDGQPADVGLSDIVLDDLVVLKRGDQVPSDCRIVGGKCSANESLLTGESDLVAKECGDELYSGSFISSGTCTAQVVAVGTDNYATRINNAAKVHRKAQSEIMDALKRIVKWVTVAIVPLGALLMIKEVVWADGTLQDAILHSSAALVGMIPQGLILLTSSVLAVSVVRLAQHKVLVQELYCVETLARVDVVCLDKTGTITTGAMEVDEVIPVEGHAYDEALHSLVALDAVVDEANSNETSKAIHAYLSGLQERPDAPPAVEGQTRLVPFSSEHKYSGVAYGSDANNYCMGATEFVLRDHPRLAEIQDAITRLAGVRRVLVVARVDGFDEQDVIMGTIEPLALVFIKDCVRMTAPQTLAYFAKQGVRINIISGDAVETVSNIAQSVGVPDADRCVDMSTVKTQEELERVARECRVFGRVSPDQKKQLVLALQKQGHTVAMTGDGVNDVLALHAADCSVAMGSGSDAARNVAKLVLLDDDFASMPHVVAEGRRSINNLQRSGSLFLVKTIFSAFLAVAFIIIQAYSYPFVTIQLTLISAMTIGLPSFVLALEPNKERVRGDFLRNVVTFALPGAVMVIGAVLISCVYGVFTGLSQEEFSTLCVVLASVAGLNLVVRLSIPYNPIRVLLSIVCIGGTLLGVTVFAGVFNIVAFNLHMLVATGVLAVLITLLFQLFYSMAKRNQQRYLAGL